MKRIVPAFGLFLSLICVSSCSTQVNEHLRKIYVYHSKNDKWCGIGGIKTFQARIDENDWSLTEAGYEDVESVAVTFRGNVVTTIEHFFTTFEAEGSKTITYTLRADGTVVRVKAQAVYPSIEYGNNQTEVYDVKDGRYVRLSNSDTKDLDFPRPKKLSDFSYGKLLAVYQQKWPGTEICE
ncbi:MAG: hypothetical protein EPO08_17380 [Rhodospirillaceae bacterium]|nr:MAG: hypothetical protein EPO08_17380 [Rhodospirillaceae bacterium]